MKKSNTKFLKKKTNVLFTYNQSERPKNAFMETGDGTTVSGPSTTTTMIFGF